MASNAPGKLQLFYLVARRFVLGAPKLAPAVCSNYQLDIVEAPPFPMVTTKRRRPPSIATTTTTNHSGVDPFPASMATTTTTLSNTSSSSLLPPASQQPPPQLRGVVGRPTPLPMTDAFPYQLEPVDPTRAPPVPSWYDSPHFRPNA